MATSFEVPKTRLFAGWQRVNEFLADRFETPLTSGRIVPMEGMRGFAALLVFAVHFNALFGSYARDHTFTRASLKFMGALGNTGVDLFFVLSGFLMYGIVLEKAPPFGSYFYRRLKRLYPVFLAVLVIYLGLSRALPNEYHLPHSYRAAAGYILANMAMLPGMLSIKPIIRVAWSLSYEWFFYLLLPLAVWAFQLRRWAAGTRLAFVLFVCGAYFGLCRAHLGAHPRLIMFGSGICLWECVRHFKLASKLPSWGEYAAIAGLVLSLSVVGVAKIEGSSFPVSKPGALISPLLFFSMFLFSLYGLFFGGILQRFFSLDWLRWIGNMSYSYYLIHGLTLHIFQMLTHSVFGIQPRSGAFVAGLGLISLPITVVAAGLLYLGIEKPLSLANGRQPKRFPQVHYEPAVAAVVAEDAMVEVAATSEASARVA